MQLVFQIYFGFKSCAFEKKCALHYKWEVVIESVNNVLISTTLEELKNSGIPDCISKNSLIFTKND